MHLPGDMISLHGEHIATYLPDELSKCRLFAVRGHPMHGDDDD